MILESIVVGPISANCFIIGDEDSKVGIIIDPGDWPEQILEIVNELNLEIKYLLCTHGHFDHIGGVAQVRAKTGAKFLIHKADLPFVKEANKAAELWGMKIEQPPMPDRYIDDGDIIKAGKLSFMVIHTPGHSPGGVSFLIDDKAFVGDTLFFRSIGRTDLPGGSSEALVKSIKTKLYTLDDNVEVYTGHGPNTTIGSEKVLNQFVTSLLG